MKIAYVLNTYPQPSHSFIRREVQALERQGFEVDRIAMRAADTELVDDGDRAEAAATHYVLKTGAPALLRDLLCQTLHAPRAMLDALRLAWRHGGRSEVGRLRHLIYLVEAAHITRRCAARATLHCHAHFGTNAATVAMLAHAMGGPHYSFTVHGPEEFDAPRALSLGDKITRSAFTVAISSFGRSQLSRLVGHEIWDRIKVVHCGIEPARFADPAPMPDGPLHLVAIGRFVEQKGQMMLVPALKAALERAPDLHLTLIGDGPLRPVLEAQIAQAGLGAYVTLTGWLDEAGVRDRLAAAHGLMMPSFAEGLPMVVMEAMAAARPVIATYIAGTPELVQHGTTGWLVPAGDTDALADAWVAMAQTPGPELAAMGAAARSRVLARHDVDTEAGKLATHIRTAADHRPRTQPAGPGKRTASDTAA
ncbi:glycosyltransferase [Pseudosulfitobacter sp. DSM 107133]|uniref:glycosyltransferase n=1 Tax=Pseudosulfitobacter sp. DSM 107133 TaxID=2883100 RepID=UPI000DF4AE43|nr:glycosyltransferase [Pseudosulfitobacter sp. DSM 107133]UOA26827.1 GDP-mannose-dependent alpha-(1-6)-phosphatidylinositol monomannoside mannosyltransferase [Pseudosulfitobacter sp. DSM 107133]